MDHPSRRIRRYALMKLAREFDARFEALLLTGRVSKWYSAIGNEAITVPAGLALEPGDVLCSLHRDVGAILAFYLDSARAFPDFDLGPPDTRFPTRRRSSTGWPARSWDAPRASRTASSARTTTGCSRPSRGCSTSA